MPLALMRSVRVLCLFTLVLCMVEGASAKGGRDLAASYQFANITENADVVHLTVTVNLRNNSGSDIGNGSVVLLSSDANPSVFGSFGLMKVVHNSEVVTVSQTFSIPKSEYQLWEQGRDPSLRFVTEDSNGAMRIQEIDLQRLKAGVGTTK